MTIKRELGIGILSIFIVAIYILFIIQQNNPASSHQLVNTNKQVTLDEVAKHNTPTDCWIVIHNKAYAVSNYLSDHPGGAQTITPYCGKVDASVAYDTKDKGKPHSEKADLELQAFYVGDIQ